MRCLSVSGAQAHASAAHHLPDIIRSLPRYDILQQSRHCFKFFMLPEAFPLLPASRRSQITSSLLSVLPSAASSERYGYWNPSDPFRKGKQRRLRSARDLPLYISPRSSSRSLPSRQRIRNILPSGGSTVRSQAQKALCQAFQALTQTSDGR